MSENVFISNLYFIHLLVKSQFSFEWTRRTDFSGKNPKLKWIVEKSIIVVELQNFEKQTFFYKMWWLLHRQMTWAITFACQLIDQISCETMQKPRHNISENFWTALCKGVKESLKGRSEEAALQETPHRKTWSW